MAPPSEALLQWVSLFANLVVALGFIAAPFAILVYLRDRRRERLERELETFTSLSATYYDYLKLCLEHPDLPCVDATSRNNTNERREDLMMQIVVSMLEEAYFLYRDQDSELKRAQWAGWNAYTRDWVTHPAFRARWPDIISQYDEGFRSYMRTVYSDVGETGA